MGIGTSLGAFFEDSFQHHAGNEYLLNPNSTPDNNELSTNSVMPETPEPVDPSHYDTPLTQGQEEKFQDWKSKMAPNDSGEDYDLRGAFLNNTKPDEKTGHWPDTFKKPNHPTFSDQSMYAGERPDLAGRWQGDVYIPPLPITPIANLTNTPDEIMSGVEGVRAWQNRGVAGPTQMRRPANDNVKDLNNPNMTPVEQLARKLAESENGKGSWSRIGGGGQEHYWRDAERALKTRRPLDYDGVERPDPKKIEQYFERGTEIINERGKLMDKLRDTGLNDLETQKLNNLDKQHAEHFRPDLDAINTEPLKNALRDHFDETVTKPHEEFIANYDKLHAFMTDVLTKKGGWTELNVARYNKMGRELDHEWTPVEFDPLK